MDAKRQRAKVFLKECTLDEYELLLKHIRLTDRQRYILDQRFGPKHRYNFQIAMDLYVSEETIRNESRYIFDKVSRYLEAV